MIGGVALVAAEFEMCASQPQSGYTALFWAARRGHTECVRLLMQGGADKDAKDEV